jgi:RNA recognition motif-containing protein
MKKMFISNLPQDTSETDLGNLFSEFGRVRSVQLSFDVFTRKCRGFGFVEMEGHEARAAVAALDGREFGGRPLRVRFEDTGKQRRGGRRR